MAALALIQLREPDAVLGLYQYCTKVPFPDILSIPFWLADAKVLLTRSAHKCTHANIFGLPEASTAQMLQVLC